MVTQLITLGGHRDDLDLTLPYQISPYLWGPAVTIEISLGCAAGPGAGAGASPAAAAGALSAASTVLGRTREGNGN